MNNPKIIKQGTAAVGSSAVLGHWSMSQGFNVNGNEASHSVKIPERPRLAVGDVMNHKLTMEILTRNNCQECYPTKIGSGLVADDFGNRDVSLPARIIKENILDIRVIVSLGTNLDIDSVGVLAVGDNIKASLEKSLAGAFNPDFKFVVFGWSFHKSVKWPNKKLSHLAGSDDGSQPKESNVR